MELLYCDGGVCGRNPSAAGGSWSWCLIYDGQMIRHASGFVTPADMGVEKVTNNHSELLAALYAIEAMPEGWNGTLLTDSKVTLYRMTTSKQFNGVPNWLRLRVLNLRRGRKWQVVLVAGHPTKPELAAGKRAKNGLPTSQWNQWADEACTAASKAFLAKNGGAL